MRTLSILLFGLLTQLAYSQTLVQRLSYEELRGFSDHLWSERLYGERAVLLSSRVALKRDSQQRIDSLKWDWAHTLYVQGDYLGSSETLPVSSTVLGERARLLASYSAWRSSSNLKIQVTTTRSSSEPLENFRLELKGSALLLDRKFAEFDSLTALHINPRLQNLHKLSEDWRKFKHRPPWVAGLCSAILPGSGKWLVGRYKQGFGALGSIVLFGVQAWEGYDKKGFNSPRFWVFGTLASVFYVGNIWGSVLAMNVVQTQLYEELHQNLALELSIPVHSLWKL